MARLSKQVQEGIAGESLSQSLTGAAPPDLKEVFNIGPPVPSAHELADPDEAWVYSPNLWPAALPSLQPAWTAYSRARRTAAEAVDLIAAMTH